MNQTEILTKLKLAKLHLQRGEFSAAKTILQLLSTQAPPNPNVLSQLGQLEARFGNFSTAINYFESAIKLNPYKLSPLNNLATIHARLGNYTQAIDLFIQALKLVNSPQIATNLATAYNQIEHYSQAESLLKSSLNLLPDQPQALFQLATAYILQNKHAQALDTLSAAVSKFPQDSGLLALLINTKQILAQWDQLDDLNLNLTQKTLTQLESGITPSEVPFITMSRSASPRLLAQVCKAHSDFQYHHSPKLHSILPKTLTKIAFISNWFGDTPTLQNTIAFLESLSQSTAVELLVTSPQPQDSFRNRVYAAAATVHTHLPQDASKLAHTIHQLNFPVLVDLKGHSSGNRLDVISQRPAFLQLTFHGFPGPIESPAIDYLITDPISCPPALSAINSTPSAYLPHTFFTSDPHTINRSNTTNSLLRKSPLKLAAFHNSYKITPPIFNLWLNLLQQHPNSQLVLLNHNPIFSTNLRAFASNKSVHNLKFSPKLPKRKHLHRLTQFSLTLDTFPATGHTTTSDSLAAGVPVVTIAGPTIASRISSSILIANGLSELITHSLDGYYQLISILVSQPTKLTRITQKLITNRSTYPFYNPNRYASNFLKLVSQALAIKSTNQINALSCTKDPFPLVYNPTTNHGNT